MDTKSSPWFAVSLGLIGIIIGYSVAQSQIGGPKAQIADPSPSHSPSPSIEAEPEPAVNIEAMPEIDFDKDHFKGNKNADVSLVVYNDLECPYCRRHHATVKQLITDYGDGINVVMRHYPLGFHQSAQKAAEASECAAELGGEEAFWNMVDKIFEKGPDNTQLASYAKELGLEETKFTECLNSGKFAEKTKGDMAGGTAAGIRGTPGNIVLNRKTGESKLVSGAQPIENFKAVIDGMME
ncbi:MAG: Periplasmic thiol:disulfide interchange protein DsbA [Candidatus Uhrbacteria bacterium GW2011_GWA2_53_10]|uniref:Periplasmic thiol:disulfide interchange protein DsbA n=1 Tax=Candidatus Uhrbacteria bacterium GW2011_GWA2_53_10 TaxID=1618980 RepID=A0A0G2AIY3_9BACT|nr:MAG: Periplasmic thiol:disulfide interchange protein DsbA [Candidatus Uhrbacteria bacterium GW2011_GWA2_53_10]